jgi:hypothetical protein
VAHVAGSENARSAAFLRQRRAVKRPVDDIQVRKQEALSVAFDGVGKPI